MKNIFLAFLLSPLLAFAQNSEYDTWILKANAFYDAHQYQQAGDAFSHAFASNGWKAVSGDLYNAACAWSQAGNRDSAFAQLDKLAAHEKFKGLNHMVVDIDLENLHADPRWSKIHELVRQNKERAEQNLNKPIIAVLDTVFQDDQRFRMQFPVVESKYGQQSKEVYALRDTVAKYDSINCMKVIGLLDKYGWLGPDVVGEGGSQTEFYVIQHSNIKVQDKYLPMLREAVKNKKLSSGLLALLEDRVSLRHKKKQVYGTQIWVDINGRFVAPLEDPDNVDKRRAAVGLGPLALYLQSFQVPWDLQEYKDHFADIEKRSEGLY